MVNLRNSHTVRWLASAGLILGLCGCPDPKGMYDEFTERNYGIFGEQEEGTCGMSPCEVPALGEIDGSYMFVFASNMNKLYPVAFKAELATTASASGGAFDFTIQMQPYASADRTTLIGDVINKGPYTVSSNGVFHADLGVLTIPPDANPLTDKETVSTALLDGKICKPVGFYCGCLDGDVTAPIDHDLFGSTFTFEGPDGQGNFPEPPRINCEGEVSDPPYG